LASFIPRPLHLIFAQIARNNQCGEAVAQIGNLLYRRIAFGKRADISRHPKILRHADYKSAIRQITNLRYISDASALSFIRQ
jgi:hypothetical protein